MERQLKERLVGAAVLVAAAVILIPEMLSGPKRESRAPTAAQTSNDRSLKTYTIDLNRSPGAAPTTTASEPLDERAPPPETDATGEEPATETAASPPAIAQNPAPEAQAKPEADTSPAPEPTERLANEAATRSPLSANPPTESPPARAAQPAPKETSPPKPIASPSSAPTSRGWAVQVGSFANRATADRVVRDLAQQGQNAFVMPVKSGSSTLYRVRVGPFSDRAAANETLREVKSRIANAAVVAHP